MAQIEQDLLIERALYELFSNPFLHNNLAFRGGTALHKLYLKPQPRYSEDIDLVQVSSGNIKPVLVEIKKAMAFMGVKRSTKQNLRMNTMFYPFVTEMSPITSMKIKIEINTREHFTVLGFKKLTYTQQNPFLPNEPAEIITYQPEELLGTKLRALYQRSKGRDLFDLYFAITQLNPDIEKIIDCCKAYMQHAGSVIPDTKTFLNNLNKKMHNSDFTGDTLGLLRPGTVYDPNLAYETVKNQMILKF
jgi:predicted nucleotidyltransferase component of viral defense system